MSLQHVETEGNEIEVKAKDNSLTSTILTE
jgi:hypothetical protein